MPLDSNTITPEDFITIKGAPVLYKTGGELGDVNCYVAQAEITKGATLMGQLPGEDKDKILQCLNIQKRTSLPKRYDLLLEVLQYVEDGVLLQENAGTRQGYDLTDYCAFN